MRIALVLLVAIGFAGLAGLTGCKKGEAELNEAADKLVEMVAKEMPKGAGDELKKTLKKTIIDTFNKMDKDKAKKLADCIVKAKDETIIEKCANIDQLGKAAAPAIEKQLLEKLKKFDEEVKKLTKEGQQILEQFKKIDEEAKKATKEAQQPTGK